jgi:phenylacetate-CoA ligase
MLRSKVRDLKLKVVITNAEPVYDYQRQAISEAFQCPVRETYGMAETVAAASECEAGRLHLWPEAGWIETTATSDLISTGLLNADMPLVRYRAGDRLLLADPVSPCACGRTLPQIASIEGRIDDVLYTSDGRRIGRLDPVFKNQLPVREAQIIQESLTRVRVLYVPDEGFDRNAARSIVEKLQERMGNIEVLLEETREIPRGASGKFRAVICKLPAEQIRELK